MKIPTKLPTWMGILLVIALVASIILFTEKMLRAPSMASVSEKPLNVRVTNITDTMFTVTWTTSSPSQGTLTVTSGIGKNTTHFDERDKTGKLGKYLTHSFSIRNATPETEYTFKPVSNGKTYLVDNKPYSTKTGASLPINDGTLDPAYGTIKTSSETPASDAIVYITIEGGQDLSTLTKPSGSWFMPLNQSRTADLTTFLPIVERMNEQISIVSGEEITTAISDTLNDSPVPDMSLGKQYDFRRQQAKTTSPANVALRPVTQTPATTPPSIAALPLTTTPAVLGVNTKQNYAVSISSPKNNAAIPSTLPVFQGTGVPGKYIGLSIGFINAIHGSVKVQQNGQWSYTPPRQLNQGNQTVTASGLDSNGKPVAITHKFSILKSGTQVLGDATPSATLTPLATPAFESPTATPIYYETPTETPISTLSGSAPPTTGYGFPTLILIVMSFGLLAGGMVIVSRS